MILGMCNRAEEEVRRESLGCCCPAAVHRLVGARRRSSRNNYQVSADGVVARSEHAGHDGGKERRMDWKERCPKDKVATSRIERRNGKRALHGYA
jgi:hypothetical protein